MISELIALRQDIHYTCAFTQDFNAFICGCCKQSLLYPVLGDECVTCQAVVVAITHEDSAVGATPLKRH